MAKRKVESKEPLDIVLGILLALCVVIIVGLLLLKVTGMINNDVKFGFGINIKSTVNSTPATQPAEKEK